MTACQARDEYGHAFVRAPTLHLIEIALVLLALGTPELCRFSRHACFVGVFDFFVVRVHAFVPCRLKYLMRRRIDQLDEILFLPFLCAVALDCANQIADSRSVHLEKPGIIPRTCETTCVAELNCMLDTPLFDSSCRASICDLCRQQFDCVRSDSLNIHTTIDEAPLFFVRNDQDVEQWRNCV